MPTDRPSAAVRRRATPRRFPNTTIVNKTPSSSTLPPQVQAVVPHCARSCLASYIGQEYNCPYNDFSCLCEEYSSQGFTLGELAFLCLRQECGSTGTNESVSVYNICNGNAAAVPATHSTLTLPETSLSKAISTSSSTSTHQSHPQTTHHTSTTSPPTISTAARSSAMPAAMGSSASQTASPASSTAAAAATSPGHATSLTSAQAVGVSIAAMGTVMLAIGAIYFIACIRRRKAKQKDDRKSYDFVDEAPPRFSPFTYGYADPRGPLGGFHKPRVELMADKRNSEWYRKHYSNRPPQRLEKNLDFNLSPESYRSKGSGRTLSQLLPEKLNATTPPRPPPRSPRPASVFTAATVFEEDRSPPTAISRPFSPTYPKAVYYPPVRKAPPPQQARDYQAPPREERRPQQQGQNQRRAPRAERQPSLSLAIPQQASRLNRIPSPTTFPPPPIPKDRQPDREQLRMSSGSKARSSKSGGSLLNYYASPEAGSDSSPGKDSPTPIDDEIQKRKPVPTAITVTKPIFPPRAVRESGASDTSFESTDPDEPTPPEEEDKQLTPVEDTPADDTPSPIAGIRYPKVPRSSNQSVPRSPNLRHSPDKKAAPKNSKLSPQLPKRPPQSTATTKPDDRSLLPSHTPAPKPNPITPPSRTHSQTPSLSGTTLAAKRRGDRAAIDLEKRLHIAELAHSSIIGSPLPILSSKSDPATTPRRSQQRTDRQESPLKGYGRVKTSYNNNNNNNNNNGSSTPISTEAMTNPPTRQRFWSPGLPGPTQEVALKSPPWDPKLTPSRRGEDLFLQVGVATPSTAGFAPAAYTDYRR